jgi:hypothetical protein
VSEVKRYDLVGDMDGNCNLNEARMELSADGIYVRHRDYAALEVKCAALAAENAWMKSGAMDEIKVINRGGQAYCVKDGVQVNPMYARGWNDYRAKSMQSDTPATDAFLAEVRAHGVEMFADHLLCQDLDDTIRDFAAQLRKGGEQK